jgi:hypothetical protein
MQNDITSLEKFLSSEEHLVKNIRKWEFEVVSKWEVNIQLYVKQANLWEGARYYVWKFLGAQNFWARQNGTKICLVKIHVK